MLPPLKMTACLKKGTSRSNLPADYQRSVVNLPAEVHETMTFFLLHGHLGVHPLPG
jgi:hypothetical protein